MTPTSTTRPDDRDITPAADEPGAETIWPEIANLVLTSLEAATSAEMWLGRIVMVAQVASEQAVATATRHAEDVLAEARTQAEHIRREANAEAQRWARRLARQRAATTGELPPPPLPKAF